MSEENNNETFAVTFSTPEGIDLEYDPESRLAVLSCPRTYEAQRQMLQWFTEIAHSASMNYYEELKKLNPDLDKPPLKEGDVVTEASGPQVTQEQGEVAIDDQENKA